jgi:eukaryotic-like serine/threonine-protein kinase
VSFPFKIPERYEPTNVRFDGGQGFVYVCHDKYLDRRVAIKVMRNVGDGDILRKELASLREIRSQNIAEIYDIVIAKRSGMVGLVQEFVPGHTLSECIEGGIAEEDQLRILYQIASGIADVHAFQKVHRDVKPDNMKFDTEKVLKILDFGLVTDGRTTGETVNARGTLHFLAPELFGDPPFPLTPAVDVYAFGVTAWLIANNGRLSRELAETPPLLTGPAPSFSNAAVRLTPVVARTLDRTLSRRPSDRPTMKGVKEILKRHILFGKHKATLLHHGQKYILAEPGDVFVINDPGIVFKVQYDGLRFVVLEAQGDVFINNLVASAGKTLPPSCVITIGSRATFSGRTFIPFDVSHPEVLL